MSTAVPIDLSGIAGRKQGLSGPGTKKPPRVLGRAGPLCPGSSDFNFLGDLKGIVDLDTKIPHGAFNLRMDEQELHRAQVAGPAVD